MTRPDGPLVVVGDSLLDIDLEGTAERLTPDAPVPVLDHLVERARPGGAALAALMAAREGVEVVLVTAFGDDEEGARLEALLAGVELRRLRYDGPTPVKRRVRASGQSLLRLDSGSEPGTTSGVRGDWEEVVRSAGAVLVSDYGRGVAAVPEVREALAALSPRVPVMWDPHPRGPAPVPGCRLVTPNASEARLFTVRLGEEVSGRSTLLAEVGRRADALVAHWQAGAVAVTLGDRGALLSYGSGAPLVMPAPPVLCLDACGAGDRFAVGAALALRSGLVTTEAVQQAVDQAAAYVALGGPASLYAEPDLATPRLPVEDLLARVRAGGGTVVATGGCFDLLHAGHVATL
ncbi:MAG: hldE, partial [Marmoricola sp.]|nr:hldE [Marmoricola sp.]